MAQHEGREVDVRVADAGAGGGDLHAPLHLTITSNISTDRIVASHGSVAPLWTDNDSGPGRSNKGANA